ncbi:NAD-dependent epimerase/dehydratase family protein [Rhodobacteraceae bacterium 2CG4]|uniref:NAD-dependent epimerase/dehydratase family protein n=1 Tax=Halovulum marinum TaxID=2662447 RepID=A0A6L5YYC4_9RHOB|nr:NAD-dependent epimerase/dehydratase family protein [Halovulum marinum]MSU89208.1 NAD-dependent epimerase/dehydratase family protein [Halovulum marinum]
MVRTLITGGCGFIGRHLARELLNAGHEVVLYDALLDQVHGGAEVALPEGARLLRGDIRDPEPLRAAVKDAGRVVHLAAEVGVGQSMYEIARYVGTNDLGTAVLLEAIAAHPVERLVLASSMSVYGEGRYRTEGGRTVESARRRADDLARGLWEPRADGDALVPVPTDETKPVELASIYALTKYAQERAVLIFGEAYDIPATALRLFNVFGAGQALSNPYTGVLANFASRLANGERPTVFEDGAQKRDFVHVEDVARAFRLALESDRAAGEVINIGSGRSYSIARVAQLLAETMGRSDLQPEILNKLRKGDIRNCFADIGKARDLLGFEPRFSLESDLGPFVEWVQSAPFTDRGPQMRRELEQRGLVA